MNYKNINDYELIYRVRENDDDALEILFDKYKPLVVKVALKYFDSVKNKGIDFDDMIQEGLVTVSQAISSYNVESNSLLYSYVLLCLDRHFMTFCRNVNSTKNYWLNNSVRDEKFYTNLGYNSDFSCNIMKYEDYIRYKNHLEIVDSCIFELRYNGFSYKEICVLLDLSYSFVECRLSKIKNILRKREKTFI